MGYLISPLQSQDPGHKIQAVIASARVWRTVLFSDADKDIWISMIHRSEGSTCLFQCFVFKENAFLDLKILWLSYCRSSDL